MLQLRFALPSPKSYTILLISSSRYKMKDDKWLYGIPSKTRSSSFKCSLVVFFSFRFPYKTVAVADEVYCSNEDLGLMGLPLSPNMILRFAAGLIMP